VAYLAGGREIAALGGDGSLRIADAATGQGRQELVVPGRPGTLAVSGDGRWIAAGGGDSMQGFVHVLGHATEDGPWVVIHKRDFRTRVRAMGFSGDRLLLGGDRSGDDRRRPAAVPPGDPPPDPPRHVWVENPTHSAVHAVSTARYSALYAAATDQLAWAGDATGGVVKGAAPHAGEPMAVAMAPDGHWLYMAGPDGISKWALTGSPAPGRATGEPEGEVIDGS
jgi:hypothetical protein